MHMLAERENIVYIDTAMLRCSLNTSLTKRAPSLVPQTVLMLPALFVLLLRLSAVLVDAQLMAPTHNYNVSSPVTNGPYVVNQMLPCTYRLFADVDSSCKYNRFGTCYTYIRKLKPKM